MEMPGRQFNATTYAYSFNGKRDDKEAEYGWQDYGMREYDKRSARFISVDPFYKRYPFYSTYQFGGNNAVTAIDLNGLEPVGSIGNGGSGDFMYRSMVDKGRYQTQINGKQIDGTLFRVVDAINADFWVLKQSKIEFYDDNLMGRRRVVNTDFFYFTKPPSKNVSDYNGGSWEAYETENRIAMRQSDQVASGIGAGFAIAVTAPFAFEGYGAGLGGAFWSKGIASAGFDAVSQLATNGGKFQNLNLTEIGASFFIQGGSWKALMAKNAIGNFGSYDNVQGYSGIGSRNFDIGNAMLKTGIGTVVDFSFEGLKNLPTANKFQLSRWKNLSYKPKYESLLKKDIFNSEIKSFSNSTLGQSSGGAASTLATNAVDSKHE